jgi:hypothetical protein
LSEVPQGQSGPSPEDPGSGAASPGMAQVCTRKVPRPEKMSDRWCRTTSRGSSPCTAGGDVGRAFGTMEPCRWPDGQRGGLQPWRGACLESGPSRPRGRCGRSTASGPSADAGRGRAGTQPGTSCVLGRLDRGHSQSRRQASDRLRPGATGRPQHISSLDPAKGQACFIS